MVAEEDNTLLGAVNSGRRTRFRDQGTFAIITAAHGSRDGGRLRNGEVCDGKIFVLPVEKVYRIRTGEGDQAAVTPIESILGAE